MDIFANLKLPFLIALKESIVMHVSIKVKTLRKGRFNFMSCLIPRLVIGSAYKFKFIKIERSTLDSLLANESPMLHSIIFMLFQCPLTVDKLSKN